jgi:GH24 family phage-related lysozyme (muramidase)
MVAREYMRHVSQDDVNLIKRAESFSATIHICAARWATIGYGDVGKGSEYRSLAKGSEGVEVPLRRDVGTAERAAERLIKAPQSDR